jgi:hypothetical protein
MVVAASSFTVGNTMIVAGVILAVVLLLRAVRRGQARPEARLGGGISGFDRRMPHLPELPDPPSPERGRSRRPRLRRREEETTTLLRPESATTSRWSTHEQPAAPPAEPPAPWHEPPAGGEWDDPARGGRS